MGFEKSHLFGKVEVDIRASVAGTIVFQTETPGQTLVNRFTMPIPVTTGQTILRSRLPGIMQGHLVRATGTPNTTPTTGHWELYGVRVWYRELPDGQWQWFPLPVMDTPVEYVPFKLVPGPGGTAAASSSEDYAEYKIPVEETPVSFVPLKAPVEATGADFTTLKVPLTETPILFTPLKVPIVETPVVFTSMKAPVEATSESFDAFKLPVKATPVMPDWISVPVDE